MYTTPQLLCHIFIYFLLLRRQPRSTLFPYTTLFRSIRASLRSARMLSRKFRGMCWAEAISSARTKRSEEHTSELQSLTNLVCRLLLEKKKKKNKDKKILYRVSEACGRAGRAGGNVSS